MNRVVHFEIPADDPETSSKFYQEIFGWTFTKWEGPMPYWLIDTGSGAPGINGGMLVRRDPAQPVANTIEVNSVDEYAAKIESLGGKIVLPKMPIPGVGYLAYFSDLDGNIFGIMHNDPNAS